MRLSVMINVLTKQVDVKLALVTLILKVAIDVTAK